MKSNSIGKTFAENDPSKFWQDIHKFIGKKRISPNNIDGETDSNKIANNIACKYEELYNTVSFNQIEMNELMENVTSDIKHRCIEGGCNSQHHISVTNIESAMKHIKSNKKDGFDDVSTSHLIHASSVLSIHMSLLFTAMLHHGFSPSQFRFSKLIPIVKNKRKSLHDSNNYRAIALSSIMGKVFDWVLLNLYSSSFNTSDLQFGFKSGSSTVTCTYVLDEVTNYYNQRGSDVFVVLLDASKAFDRVNYIHLFNELKTKALCPLVLRFLINMYILQSMCVSWENENSFNFLASNGVKQGGVLSPILYGIYNDLLLTMLKEFGIGCYVGCTFVGALAYADDVVLLCPTKTGLLKMLNICKQFSCKYDVVFNANKSKLIVYSNIQTSVNNINITFQGKKNSAESGGVHLGNIIGKDSHKKRISDGISEFNKRLNVLLLTFSHCHSSVKYHLFKTFCMPLYGSQLWDLTLKESQRLYTAWYKAVRRIYKISPRSHRKFVYEIADDPPIDFQIHRRFIKFVHSLLRNKNQIVNMCVKLAMEGSCSPLCNNISLVCFRYQLDRNAIARSSYSTSFPIVKRMHYNNLTNDDKATVQFAKELISSRDYRVINLCKEHLSFLLDYMLCD